MISIAKTEPEIGSIVCRFSSKGDGLVIGQIVAEDKTIRPKARWMVFSGGEVRPWHSATVLRVLRDWNEAERVEAAGAAVIAMRDELRSLGADDVHSEAATRRMLAAISSGAWKP